MKASALTFEQIAEMRRLWAEGFDTYEISRALNVSEALVYNGGLYSHPVALPDAEAEGEGR